VPLTEPPPGRVSKPTLLDVTYEDVRQSFLLRLQNDEVRLAMLRGALGSAEVSPARAFADLEVFAHRLRGAAAVFNFPELRDAAKGLELASAVAAAEHSPMGEPLVQSAVRLLATRLARLNGSTLSSDAEERPVPAN